MRRNHVFVDVKRIGGGFGGKDPSPVIIAVPTALCAKILKVFLIFGMKCLQISFQVPVKCVLERMDDMTLTGTRHPMLIEYKGQVDKKSLKLEKMALEFYSNCGHTGNMSQAVMCNFSLLSRIDVFLTFT